MNGEQRPAEQAQTACEPLDDGRSPEPLNHRIEGRDPAPQLVTESVQPPSPEVIDLRDDPTTDTESEIDLRDGLVAAATLASTRTSARAVSGRPLDLAEGLTLVEIDEPDERWAQTERFVYEIYQEAGYCAESSRSYVEELQGWEHLSRLQVVFDEDGMVIGTARSIVGPFRQLPIGKFARLDHEDADPVAELSALAITPSARGISVVVHLCRAVFVDAWRKRASALMFAIDGWMVDLLADSYALPIRPIGSGEFYMGGDITPSGMTLRGSEFQDCARRNPGYWAWMTEAFTVEEIVDLKLPIVLDTVAPSPTDKPRSAPGTGRLA